MFENLCVKNCGKSIKIMPTNLKNKRTHNESRSVVCAFCFGKALKARKLSVNQKSILDHEIQNFSVIENLIPLVACNTCRIKLDNKKSISIVNYDDKNLVEKAEECDCDICDVARAKPGN